MVLFAAYVRCTSPVEKGSMLAGNGRFYKLSTIWTSSPNSTDNVSSITSSDYAEAARKFLKWRVPAGHRSFQRPNRRGFWFCGSVSNAHVNLLYFVLLEIPSPIG